MSLLVRDGVSTEQRSSHDGRRQRVSSKIEERSSIFAATWEVAVLCAAQQPPVAREHAFASSRVAKTPGGATAPGAKEATSRCGGRPSLDVPGYSVTLLTGVLDGGVEFNLSLRLVGEAMARVE